MMKNVFLTFLVLTTVLTLSFEASAETAAQTAAAASAADTAVQPVAEDQIPLTIDAAQKNGPAANTSTKAMMSLVVVTILAGVSFYMVRRYKVSNTINKSNMQIKILTQHHLGPKKSLAIVHVAGESILIGVTDSNISMIKSLSLIDDEVPAGVPNTFGQVMQNTPAMETAIAAAPAAQAGTVHELDEEFSFSNVTDTVSKKIKSMRSFS